MTASAAAGAVAAEQSLAASAQAFYALLAALSANAAQVAGGMWDGLDAADLIRSWNRLSLPDRLLVTTGVAQRSAATAASRYVREAVTAQAGRSEGDLLDPSSLVGVASDGRDLDDLLASSLIRSLEALGKGATGEQAKAMGRSTLTTIVGTQVADTGRAATSVAMTADPQVTGYVRMLTPPSCGRCAVLAGRHYRWSSGFDRHPQCFPAGTVVSGPATQGATRRWYDGELVILATASGQELSLTANHPVLTRRGWVPAHLVDEGDEVFRSTRPQRASVLDVPDHHQVPSLIEEVWGALGVDGLLRMPASPEDFHGDGDGGDVDVVRADRALSGGLDAAFGEHARQQAFTGRCLRLAEFREERPPVLLQVGDLAFDSLTGEFRRPVATFARRRDLRAGLAPGRTGTREGAGFTAPSSFNAASNESTRNSAAADAVLLRERVLASSGQVGGNDVVVRQLPFTPRWDAPSAQFSVQTREGYASRGLQLLDRLTGQVEGDRVVERRRVSFRGHVYSLTSVEGWHTANGLIVSNCDCVHIPSVEDVADDLRTDPDAYFNSLSAADQDRYFGRVEAEAIRQGADLGQVVNARRGARGLSQPGRLTAAEAAAVRGGRAARLQRVDVYGRQLAVTSEGTTKRGLAGQRLIAESGSTRSRGERLRRAKVPRLMPAAIQELAGDDRELARDLLYRNGYLLA